MNQLVIIACGALLGMLLLTAVKSVYVQRSKKYALNFLQALKVYTTKYTGPIVVGWLVVFIVMFAWPEIVNYYKITPPIGDAQTEIKYTKWFGWIVINIRIFSVLLGILSQGLGFLAIRKGDTYLKQAEEKIFGSSDNDEAILKSTKNGTGN